MAGFFVWWRFVGSMTFETPFSSHGLLHSENFREVLKFKIVRSKLCFKRVLYITWLQPEFSTRLQSYWTYCRWWICGTTFIVSAAVNLRNLTTVEVMLALRRVRVIQCDPDIENPEKKPAYKKWKHVYLFSTMFLCKNTNPDIRAYFFTPEQNIFAFICVSNCIVGYTSSRHSWFGCQDKYQCLCNPYSR